MSAPYTRVETSFVAMLCRNVSRALDERDPPDVPNMWLKDARPPAAWIVPTNPYVMAVIVRRRQDR